MVNCDTKTQVVDVLCSSPKPCTTQHQTPNFSAMDNLRKLIVMELSTLNPSKLVENRLHSHVESQLQALIDDLPTPTHPPYASMIQRAIEELKEGGGLSERAISEFIVREYENLPLGHEDILTHHLGKLCQRGQLVCTVDRKYILRVDGGAAKKKGAVLVGWKSRKKWQGRRKEVSKPCGGEENQSMEREIGGKTEAQGMRINRIDEERKGEEEREAVLGMIDQRIEEEVSRPSGVEDRGGEIGEENQPMEREIEGGTEAQEMRIDGIDEEKENKTDEGREEALGKLAQGIEETNEAVEEQFEAERQDMKVTEVQIQAFNTFLPFFVVLFFTFLHVFVLNYL